MAAASAVQAHLRQPASSSESADAAGGGDAGAAMAGDQEGLHALVALTSVAAIDCLQDVAELNAVLERGRIRLRAPLLVERERQAALSALFRAMTQPQRLSVVVLPGQVIPTSAAQALQRRPCCRPERRAAPCTCSCRR